MASVAARVTLRSDDAVTGEWKGLDLDDRLLPGPHETDVLVLDVSVDFQNGIVRNDTDDLLARRDNVAGSNCNKSAGESALFSRVCCRGRSGHILRLRKDDGAIAFRRERMLMFGRHEIEGSIRPHDQCES